MWRSLSLLARVRKYRRLSTINIVGERNMATTKEPGGFAKSLEMHDKALETVVPSIPFTTLLRNSKFIDLGDPENKVVTGTIFHVVNDDLYIDFGWKFHCVCPRPPKNSADYVRGAKVRLRIKDLELSSKFLGMEKDLTLLEADATILGIVYSPARSQPNTATGQSS